MQRIVLFAGAISVAGLASPAFAQRTEPTTTVSSSTSTIGIDDPNILNAVQAAAIRYNKLMLITNFLKSPTALPSNSYTSEKGAKILVEDGVIVKYSDSNHKISVTSTKLTTSSVIVLTPYSVGGLLSDMGLQDGTYKSSDLGTSLTIANGKPTQFILRATTSPTTATETSPTRR